MYTFISIVVTLCAIFHAWVVGIALAIVAFISVLIILKLIALVMDAVPFL